jgi:hypothetical protein
MWPDQHPAVALLVLAVACFAVSALALEWERFSGWFR